MNLEDIYSYQPADKLFSILHNDFCVDRDKAIQLALYNLSDEEVAKALDWFKCYLTDISYKELAPSSIRALLIEGILTELQFRLKNSPGISNVNIYSIKSKTEITPLGEKPIESEWSNSNWEVEADWCFYDSSGKYIGDHHPWDYVQDLVHGAEIRIRRLTGEKPYLNLKAEGKYEW